MNALTERMVSEALRPWQRTNETDLEHGKFVLLSVNLSQLTERLNKALLNLDKSLVQMSVRLPSEKGG